VIRNVTPYVLRPAHYHAAALNLADLDRAGAMRRKPQAMSHEPQAISRKP
jgi:hypothetical protein